MTDTGIATARAPVAVAVIGGGSFGSAIADIMGSNGHPVLLWLREEGRAREFNATRVNAKYLPGVELDARIRASADLEEVARAAALIFIAVPSPHFREVAGRLSDWVDGSQILVSCTKGMEAGSFKLMSQILREETCCKKLGVLSGPNLAKEIVAKVPSGTVIASRFEEVRRRVQAALSGPYFRVYANDDIHGVELAGVLKNVYAIAAGLVAALGLGDNTKGMLLTRGLAEMSRFAARLGADPLTFLGLAGVGDLVATCFSPLSRNYRVGFQLGQGKGAEEAVRAVGEVAEGVNTVRAVYERLPALGIRMRILEGLHGLLYRGRGVDEVVRELMHYPQMEDVEAPVRNSPA